MIITIKEIHRDKIQTKYGEKDFIKIIPVEEDLIDINGDAFKLDGRRISGFPDKSGETAQWVKGMKIRVQLKLQKKEKDGKTTEFINFGMPDGVSSIVEQPKSDDVTVTEPDF
jgi:hypothetical protein